MLRHCATHWFKTPASILSSRVRILCVFEKRLAPFPTDAVFNKLFDIYRKSFLMTCRTQLSSLLDSSVSIDSMYLCKMNTTLSLYDLKTYYWLLESLDTKNRFYFILFIWKWITFLWQFAIRRAYINGNLRIHLNLKKPRIIGAVEKYSIIKSPMARTVMKQSRETSYIPIPALYKYHIAWWI